jgi:hypothetical protein
MRPRANATTHCVYIEISENCKHSRNTGHGHHHCGAGNKKRKKEPVLCHSLLGAATIRGYLDPVSVEARLQCTPSRSVCRTSPGYTINRNTFPGACPNKKRAWIATCHPSFAIGEAPLPVCDAPVLHELDWAASRKAVQIMVCATLCCQAGFQNGNY